MPDPNTPHTICKDVWIEHAQGRIFARVWQPGARDPALPAESPIVLFHDSLGSVELWRTFPGALSVRTGRKVIAYDRLGFGRSSGRRDLLGDDFISDEAETFFPVLCEQLNVERFIAFGHSVGGGMAITCAATFPDACEALITESALAFLEEKTIRGILQAKEQFNQDGQIERLQKYHGEKARWVLAAWIDTWLHPRFAAWSLASVLSRVVCPSLVIHGAEDEYGSLCQPETIAGLTGGRSRLEIIPDTFHVPHREREQVVVDLVASFLVSVRQIAAIRGN